MKTTLFFFALGPFCPALFLSKGFSAACAAWFVDLPYKTQFFGFHQQSNIALNITAYGIIKSGAQLLGNENYRCSYIGARARYCYKFIAFGHLQQPPNHHIVSCHIFGG